MKQQLWYVAKKAGKTKAFKTEAVAFKFAERDSSIALYKSKNGVDLTFVRIAGIKTDVDTIERILTEAS